MWRKLLPTCCVNRSVAAAIAAERDQARHYSFTDDERSALQQQWSDLQPFTKNILEGLLDGGRDTLSLFHLILLAIGEERRHALCNSELEQHTAHLEIKLSEYRQIIDLEDPRDAQRG
jgi:hypothetical protein